MAGKSSRRGITVKQASEYLSDNAKAEAWFEEQRWPNGPICPHCKSDNIHERKKRKPQPYQCRECKRNFSVKVGTVMQSSKVSYSDWWYAFYLHSTNLKGISSMKLHRDLGLSQKTTWHLLHRIRETWDEVDDRFDGPVEVDETFMGGKERNKHANKKLRAGRGTVGKIPVAGMKDRETNMVKTRVVGSVDRPTLQRFVHRNTAPDATVYTDEASAYQGIRRPHQAVNHGKGRYVVGDAHTNGIESHWAMLKRAYMGVYHKMSPKHLPRYIREFEGRHNNRALDTTQQMEAFVQGTVGRRLRWTDLTAD